MTEMIPVDHPGHSSPAEYFADVLARSLCRETRARAWCEETSAYAPIKQKRCPVSLPGKAKQEGKHGEGRNPNLLGCWLALQASGARAGARAEVAWPLLLLW